MTYKSLIPNMLTSSNLVFGVCSIFSTMRGDFFWGALFILVALVADGLDGRAARFFGVSSEIGKEMDSLCDLVSFGVAPGILAYVFCMDVFSWFGCAVAICFALCGAWRLARFNVNVNVVHGYFMGLAIPAGGCFVATSTLLFQAIGLDPHSLGWLYPIVMLIVAFLMVSTVHYPDFKGKGERIYPVSKIAFVAIFAAILYLGRDAIGFAVLFAVFATYAAFGIINTVVAGTAGKS
ncbi:MAG: CDP-diacylglycerol--serine O-phosphatidyltransferase [Schwartzia sp.]|nr:CDP-diacylglycerol--serine O-phosphatidyltransferase [Schwartzia sp. (in: firmicutes)]